MRKHIKMSSSSEILIASLVDDLHPVRPLSMPRGLLVAASGTILTLLVVVLFIGIRPEIVAGHFNPIFMLASGLFLMLGVAASVAVIVMSRPQVGNEHGGWIWAAAMAGLLPLTALLMGLATGPAAFEQSSPAHGLDCLIAGTALSIIVGSVLTLWLRRGAPTSAENAGLLTGVAAGSFGIFAFSFQCQFNNIYHIGLWHSLVVVISAMVGRILVPRLIRW